MIRGHPHLCSCCHIERAWPSWKCYFDKVKAQRNNVYAEQYDLLHGLLEKYLINIREQRYKDCINHFFNLTIEAKCNKNTEVSNNKNNTTIQTESFPQIGQLDWTQKWTKELVERTLFPTINKALDNDECSIHRRPKKNTATVKAVSSKAKQKEAILFNSRMRRIPWATKPIVLFLHRLLVQLSKSKTPLQPSMLQKVSDLKGKHPPNLKNEPNSNNSDAPNNLHNDCSKGGALSNYNKGNNWNNQNSSWLNFLLRKKGRYYGLGYMRGGVIRKFATKKLKIVPEICFQNRFCQESTGYYWSSFGA